LHHVLEHLVVERVALLLEYVEGEHDVVGGKLGAVGEMRLGPQMERHRHAVVGDLCALGDETVHRVGFVARRRHQRVEQKLEPLRRVTLENVVVEAVEGGHSAPADEREGAALGRLGVGVVEVLEVGWIGEIAEGGESVLSLGGGGRGGDQGNDEEGNRPNETSQGVRTGHYLCVADEGRVRASSWSYHQTCRKPGVSRGSTLGWP